MKTLALTALLFSSVALGDTSVAGAATPAPRATAACYREAALSRAIHCKGRSCTIDRAALDCWLDDTTEMAKSARIVPSIHDGRASGFKLYAIRPGSLFAHLQILNGDELQTINGLDLSSPEKALEVYTRLRSASAFEVALIRRGAPLTLHYQLVGEGRAPTVQAAGPISAEPPRQEPGPTVDFTRDVQCESAGHCRITRAMIDRFFSDGATEVRLVPSVADGKPNGFKLFAIRADSFLDRIGLRNGDVVVEVNGHPFESPDQALEVYTKVRGSSEISMVVLRNGQRSTMEYTIR